MAGALAGCGGGSGGSSSDLLPLLPNASPGGIWRGADPISGLALSGVVTEAGDFNFVRADGVQYYGTLTTSQNNISGTFSGIVPAGTAFEDGSTQGTGTVSGTIVARQTITATLTFVTANNSSSTGSGSLSFDTLYNSGSALTTVAGNYVDSVNNSVISVSADGTLFDQIPASNCVLNGQVSIIDSRYDAYQVQYTYSNCVGNAIFLNGTTATGLSFLDTNANPVVSYTAVIDTAANYASSGNYTKQ